MRDLTGFRHPRRRHQLLSARLAITAIVSVSLLAGSARWWSPVRVESAHAATATGHRHHRLTPAQRRRQERRKTALKNAALTLSSSSIRKLQAAGSVLPFTLRFRRPYEGGPGDDLLELAWDSSAVAWPLAGTEAPATPSTTNLDGAVSYAWDFGADTSGYSTLGTVETLLGAGVSMTGTGFPIAVAQASGCTTMQRLNATGVSFVSAGARFGTVNPFSGEVNGTINLRPTVRTWPVTCAGVPTTATALDVGSASDPPLPVAFTGSFNVSPSITSDGLIRLGTLRVVDTPQAPQRSTFGLIHACTDPAAADGCASMAFPVRTKLLSLTADVLVGDHLPAPAPAP